VVFELFVVLVWLWAAEPARKRAAGRRPGKVSVESLPMDASFGV